MIDRVVESCSRKDNILGKSNEEKEGPKGFGDKGEPENRLRDDHEISSGGMQKRRLNDFPPLERNASPHQNKKTVEKVMIPSPPIWNEKNCDHLPGTVESLPVSITTRPVTQTAEVD